MTAQGASAGSPFNPMIALATSWSPIDRSGLSTPSTVIFLLDVVAKLRSSKMGGRVSTRTVTTPSSEWPTSSAAVMKRSSSL